MREKLKKDIKKAMPTLNQKFNPVDLALLYIEVYPIMIKMSNIKFKKFRD